MQFQETQLLAMLLIAMTAMNTLVMIYLFKNIIINIAFIQGKLDIKPVKLKPSLKKQNSVVYNPSKDIDFVMSGKLVDMYD